MANEAKRQNEGGRASLSDLHQRSNDVVKVERLLPDDGCRPASCSGHREHGGLFPLPLLVIMPIRSDRVLPGYLQQRPVRKQAQQRLFRESVIALNSLSDSGLQDTSRGARVYLRFVSVSISAHRFTVFSILRSVRAKVISAGPPLVGLFEQEALTELLRCQDLILCSLASRGLRSPQVTGPKGRVLPKDVVDIGQPLLSPRFFVILVPV